MAFKITVVISTWRRPHILSKVLTALERQTMEPQDFEVMVIDSHSGDATESVVKATQARRVLNLRYVNVELNSVCSKRNAGIDTASGRYIVFLDDDCVPKSDHLSTFFATAAGHEGERVVWCGGVRFSPDLVSRSNYYRYRNSCHFSVEQGLPHTLPFNEIVTMNMLIERALLADNHLRFDERFIGYGLEDVYFGLCLERAGIALQSCAAEIEHIEPHGDILSFRKKFFHSARDGMPRLLAVAHEDLHRLGQTAWLEPSPPEERWAAALKRRVIQLILDSGLPRMMTIVLRSTDRYRTLYCKAAYRFCLAGSYREGVRARRASPPLKAMQANREGWYK